MLVTGLSSRVVGGRLVIRRDAIEDFRRRNQRKEVIIRARVPGYSYRQSPSIEITASVLAVRDWNLQDVGRNAVSLRLYPRADGIAVIVAHEETRIWDPGRRRFLSRGVRNHTFFVRTGSSVA